MVRYKENAKKSKFVKNKASIIFLTVMMIIPILHWFVFWLSVNFSSILLAFQNRFGEFTFMNFKVFWQELTSGTIKLALFNTFIYFFTNIAIIFPLSLIISYFIYKKIAGYKAFRFIFYLPAIISGVVMVKVFMEFISPLGPLGSITDFLGINLAPEGLLGRDQSATATIVAFCIWTGFSGNMILMSGAMSRIPVEVLESAKLDGIKPMREIVSIILPLIWNSIGTMLVFLCTGIFSASGPILLFKPEGGNMTTTLSFWIFQQVYGTGAIGGTGSYNMVSCAGLCFTLAGVPLILGAKWIIDRVPSVDY